MTCKKTKRFSNPEAQKKNNKLKNIYIESKHRKRRYYKEKGYNNKKRERNSKSH